MQFDTSHQQLDIDYFADKYQNFVQWFWTSEANKNFERTFILQRFWCSRASSGLWGVTQSKIFILLVSFLSTTSIFGELKIFKIWIFRLWSWKADVFWIRCILHDPHSRTPPPCGRQRRRCLVATQLRNSHAITTASHNPPPAGTYSSQ